MPTNSNGIAVDGQYIYWATFGSLGTIGRSNLDGSGANPTFISGAFGPVGVAVDGQHVYWANRNLGTIGRANLDGSNPNENFIAGATFPEGVAVDSRHIYWANDGTGTIGRANLDGSSPDQSFITGGTFPGSVTVDGQHVYWADGVGTVGRANLDGSGVDHSFITGGHGPVAVAVDGQDIYWANFNAGTIGRANLDGTGVNQSFITGASQPWGVAVDDGPAGTATPSAASLSFGTQPLGTLGAPQTLTVTNTGHGVLQIGPGQVTGPASDDFLISADTCSGARLPIGAACMIDVRFGPSVSAQRGAIVTFTSNDIAAPLLIPVSGTGGALPQGPSGPQGQPGKNGVVELVSCRTVTRTVLRKLHGKRKRVKVKQQLCTVRMVTGPVKFTTSVAGRAVLSRRGVTYATGVSLRAAGDPRLLLDTSSLLPPGRYTLTVIATRHGVRRITYQNVTIGRGAS